MWEALREGLDEEMERDPTVCLMGAPAGFWRAAGILAACGNACVNTPALKQLQLLQLA